MVTFSIIIVVSFSVIIYIILLFIASFVLIYGDNWSGELGTFAGISTISPNSFEYIELGNNAIIKDGSQAAYKMDLESFDQGTIILFVVITTVYFFICETTLKASLGKRPFGIIIDNKKRQKINASYVLVRSILRCFIIVCFISLHFIIKIPLIWVVTILIIYEIINTHYTFLDNWSDTKYIMKTNLPST